MSSKVACAICQKLMTYINNKHLASHGITAKEYHETYPGRPLMSEEVAAKLSARSVKANEGRKGVPRSEKDLAAIRAAVAKLPSRVGIKTGPMSEEQKKKLSQIMREKFADGRLKPPFKGRHHTDDSKRKLAEASRGQTMSEASKAKKLATYRANRAKGLHKDTSGYRHSKDTLRKISLKISERFARERAGRRSVMLPRIEESNLNLLNAIDADYFELECRACGYKFRRRPQCFQPAKFHKEQCDQCFPISPRSVGEVEIFDFVQSLLPDEKIIASDMEVIGPLELDILVPSKNIAIEYCGLWWHSEIAGKDRFYHRQKMETCLRKDVRLITIFEDEWINNRIIVESMLRNALGFATRRIDARKCDVRQIEPHMANSFLKSNHIQGRGRSAARYGLFLNEELVSVMTFSDSGVSRKLQGWEINRFCSTLGASVRGGASRLFSAFVRDYQPASVISYADLRWGEGNLYGKLGFRLEGKTVPNYWYFRMPEIRRLHRYALRKNESDPVGKTEWELRQAEGWNRIWDCGHAKWVWKAS